MVEGEWKIKEEEEERKKKRAKECGKSLFINSKTAQDD